MWKTILYAHDFSDCAAAVEGTVVDLAVAFRARVLVCHVTQLGGDLSADTMITPPGETRPLRLEEFTLRASKRRLDAIAGRLRAREVECRTLALLGSVPHGILRAALDQGADVIVMGTHGRTGLDHLLLGSVAEKVLRQATVPVVTLRTDAAPPQLREDEVLSDEREG